MKRIAHSTTASTVARRWGVRRCVVERCCVEGLLRGAWFDRATWQWRIPVPVVLQR